MHEEILKMFSRLKQTTEGLDFVAYLKTMSAKNYEEWKRLPFDMNDVKKGQAIVYDDLIKLFEECDDKLSARNAKVIDSII